jgi:hypothetical protein
MILQIEKIIGFNFLLETEKNVILYFLFYQKLVTDSPDYLDLEDSLDNFLPVFSYVDHTLEDFTP